MKHYIIKYKVNTIVYLYMENDTYDDIKCFNRKRRLYKKKYK